MRPERPEIGSRRSTRSQSLSSDITGYGLSSPPASINPAPAYIAVSAASQLVASELETDEVTVAPSALNQLNSFLDHILFNILLSAKSTKLSSLKPAVYNVLKPKLGKTALAGAEEELREYLGDEDDEDDIDESDPDAKRDFDLELAWKLARLRCMVYSRLGDLEEDDEDEYIESEQLDERGGRPRRFSNHPSKVTTASAIFLTSIIEYLSEQALAYAAQASQRKFSRVRGQADAHSATERIVVGDADMRYLGRDSPLQKLWRGWRHHVRVPADPSSRPISPDSPMIPSHSRKESLIGAEENDKEAKQRTVDEILEETDPAVIALPESEHDISEIEVPGYSVSFAQRQAAQMHLRRLRSLERLVTDTRPPTPVEDGEEGRESDDENKAGVEQDEQDEQDEPISPTTQPQPKSSRKRPLSLPMPVVTNPLELSSELKRRFTDDDSVVDDFETAEIDLDDKIAKEELLADTKTDDETTGSHSDEDASVYSEQALAMEPSAKQEIAELAGDDAHPISALPVIAPVPVAVAPVELPSEVEMPKPSMAKSVGVEQPGESAISSRPHPLRTTSKSPQQQPEQPRPSPPVIQLDNPVPEMPKPRSGTTYLAPLTETREQPRDRNVVLTPSQEALKRQAQYIIPPDPPEPKHRSASQLSSHTKSSSGSSKRQTDRQSYIDPGVERAAVQRLYPDSSALGVSNSAGSGKEKRPGTGASQPSVTRPGRGSTEGAHKGRRSTEQDLENLIRSRETLKYTLTPQNMREIESPDSPRYKVVPLDFPEHTSRPSGDFRKDAKMPSVKTDALNGLRSNPPGTMAISPTGTSFRPPTKMQPQRPAPAPMAAKSSRSQYLARDAKGDSGSLRDLADFAKSTGPEGPAQLPRVVSSSPQSKRSKTSIGSRFQAREPVIKGPNSDLIDFIREGPPRVDGSHRIPRTVAPFRTTMDSDELNDLARAPASGGRHSESSNQDSSTVTRSTVNSRTGLMDSTNRRTNVGPSQASGNPNGAPRKQRRNLDPYAIDDSDDEIDDRSHRPPPREEESLIDFLRNTSPPIQNSPKPLLHPSSNKHIAAQSQQSSRPPVTTNGFRDKLKRSTSTHSLTRNGELKTTGGRSRTGTGSSPQAAGARDTYKPAEVNHSSYGSKSRHKATGSDGKDGGQLSGFFSRKRRIVT